jgi:Ca2+-binding EF-hand superfamily protein/catechol 2,3-dioxygenase-like lactoylglutathione lyase family enzyme
MAQESPRSLAGGGLAERFQQLDRDGDGKISRNEGGSLPFFDAADKNKDGFLTVEEVQAYFAARRTAQSANPSTTTTSAAPAAARGAGASFNADAFFQSLDKNQDGKLSRDEVKAFPKVNESFDNLDTNRDGGISLEEFKAVMGQRQQRQPQTANPPAPTTPARPVAASRLAQPDGFVVDDVTVGEPGISYADPEILSEVNRMVFQTGGTGVQEVWIAELDPLTGLFRSATGKDLLVDTGAAKIGPQFDTTNGPEWGLDREGAAVFYSKRDANGVVQCWRASNLVPGGVKAEPLTHLKGPDGEGPIMVIARKDASRPTTQFIYRYIPAPRFRKGGPARWADETAPDAVHDIPQFNGAAAAPSWIEGTEDFVYAMFVAPGKSEIARFNTATGTATVLTSHPGAKYNIHAFKAPELNGELLVGCVIDRTRFTVFRSDGTRYVPWADLVPPDPEHPYMISPEMFQAGGMTYLAVQMSSHSPGSLGVLPQDVDCAMWILGLGKDASHRVARRVDEGAVTGAKAYRFEPEVYVGANEVFLFYNIGNTLHGARTGIKVAAVSPAATKPAANPAPAATGAVKPVAPAAAGSANAVSSLAKPSLEVCLNASDADRATKFFAEGLGLAARGEPRSSTGGVAMRMLLFTAGNSTVKVRVYQQTPAKLSADIAARNGLRVLTIPVEKLNDTVARLKRLGFEVTDLKQTGTMRWALARNADSTAFELVETQPGTAQELEIGLVVPDLAKAREFFTGVYGAKELPETTSRVLPGEKELRFTTGATVFKCWAPKGQRESDTGKIPDVLGFRYVTHNVRDTQALHDALTAKGVEIASPLSSHRGLASLFIIRGPGGALLEFVGPAAAGASGGRATGRTAARQIPQQMQDMFKRLDRDGDGKLSPQELPNAERFRQMDANGDGFVTLEEAAKSFSGGGAAGRPSRPVTGKEPELHPPADRAFLDFKFTTDYFAARQPADSELAKATEANALVPHNGMLYCCVSYMPESKRLTDLNPKVLVKKSATSPWEVDLEAGPEFMRLGFMRSVTFTTDGNGKKLPKPVSVLVAGTGAWRSQPTGVVVFSRNDGTGKWIRTELSPDRWNRAKLNHTTEVRCIFDHVDRVTGVHVVFAGSATGRIYRGVYDPSEPGLIKWDKTPEIEGLLGHVLCAAEANGVQYVGIAYGATEKDIRQDPDRSVKDHGLFRRIDGFSPRWEWVPIKEWEDPQQPGRSLRTSQLRGMTAVPAPDGKGEVLLVAWDTRDAVIERIDPRNNFKTTVELDVRDFFQKAWGRRVGISTFAYNDMLPVTHPDTGEKAHLIGLWLLDPNGEGNEIGKSSWYLVRYADGAYRYGRIWDKKNPLADARYGLRGCRSIRPSPFPEEAGRVWYFCGFDQTGARGAGATGPTAWIYKGTLKAK